MELTRAIKVELLVSTGILLELAGVLKSKFDWQDADIADVVRTIGYCTTSVKPRVAIKEIADDPDNRVLECAVDGEADYIVSGDHHLLDLESYHEIQIIKARDLLDVLLETWSE